MFTHEWEPAEGTVIDIRYRQAGDTARTARAVRYLVEVRPQSGEPFRVEVEPPPLMLAFKTPAVGQVVKMECDPVRGKARFDRHDPTISKKAAQDAAIRRWEAELSGEA